MVTCNTTVTLCASQLCNIFFAENLGNLALGRPTKQSSTSMPAREFAARMAVDGNPHLCSFTSGKDVPWWLVELGAVFRIQKVVITNGDVASGV